MVGSAVIVRGLGRAFWGAVLLGVASVAMAAPASGSTWTGTWKTDRGTMRLVQQGDLKSGATVTGTVSMVSTSTQGMIGSLSFDTATINAIAMDDTLAGTWKQPPTYGPPNDAGDILFTLSADGNAFAGNWCHGYQPGAPKDKTWEGKWDGSRVGGKPAVPSIPAKRSACASAKPSITSGSVFETATFTIGGSQPQTVRITQSASNFAIKKQYGGLVYQVIDGKHWGSLTLEPGTYVLSCNGGGAMGLMSASVCVEYAEAAGAPPGGTSPPSTGGGGAQPDPGTGGGGKKPKPKPDPNPVVLPKGPATELVIRARGYAESELVLKPGQKRDFMVAWARDTVGNKIGGIHAEEWLIDNRKSGSIDQRSGEFTAGPQDGDVVIKAKARNKKGDWISGTFPVAVSKSGVITFLGKVKLIDQNGKPLPSMAGSKVVLNLGMYKSLEHQNKNLSEPDYVRRTRTNRKGNFKIRVPNKRRGAMPLSYSVDIYPPNNRLPPEYEWGWIKRSDTWMSTSGPLEQGSTVQVPAVSGLPHFRFVMKKADTVITGRVTHHGKLQEDTRVKLMRNGEEEAYGWSTGGTYSLWVDGLPAGRYTLTADQNPSDFSGHTTIHNWLTIKKKIEIDLPSKQQKTVIDIELLSWADKIGYTGP